LVNVLAIDPRYTGQNPAEDDKLLVAIKIHITTAFVEEEKPSVPRNILRYIKKPDRYEGDIS
jgi:hypothetical protein